MPSERYGEYPVEKAIAVSAALTRAGIPHAFGGAIALMFFGEPRGTVDVDFNVFIPDGEARRAFAAMRELGAEFDHEEAFREVDKTSQVRISWDRTWIDLFFSFAPFHDSVAARVKEVVFGGVSARVISGEDLMIFKMLFSRPRDWFDIEMALQIQRDRVDLAYIRKWLPTILGDDDSRVARFETLVAEVAARA